MFSMWVGFTLSLSNTQHQITFEPTASFKNIFQRVGIENIVTLSLCSKKWWLGKGESSKLVPS